MPRQLLAAEDLVLKNLPLIRWVGAKFHRFFRMSRSDAVQTAALGMLYAARRYRADGGAGFTSYAIKRMTVPAGRAAWSLANGTVDALRFIRRRMTLQVASFFSNSSRRSISAP